MRRWLSDAWPVVQTTLAATCAWIVALHILDHDQPFFAPISAVVALQARRGDRGRNVVRILCGLGLGIAIGQVTLQLLGPGYGRLGLAILVSMTAAQAVSQVPVIAVQAAAGAILTVAVQTSAPGIHQLEDALVGGLVSLVFTQLVFTPEPVRLVRRAQRGVIAALASGLFVLSDTLVRDDHSHDDDDLLDALAEVRRSLLDLRWATRASRGTLRYSVRWRSRARAEALAREHERSLYLDRVADGYPALARTTIEASHDERERLAPVFRALARSLAALMWPTRTRARGVVGHAAQLARELDRDYDHPESGVAARTMALDLMKFVELDPWIR